MLFLFCVNRGFIPVCYLTQVHDCVLTTEAAFLMTRPWNKTDFITLSKVTSWCNKKVASACASIYARRITFCPLQWTVCDENRRFIQEQMAGKGGRGEGGKGGGTCPSICSSHHHQSGGTTPVCWANYISYSALLVGTVCISSSCLFKDSTDKGWRKMGTGHGPHFGYSGRVHGGGA